MGLLWLFLFVVLNALGMSKLGAAWKVVGFIALGTLAGWLTGADALFAGVWGALDDVVLLLLGSKLTYVEQFAFTVFIDETEHMVSELHAYAEEDERQRQARAAALARWHPGTVYVYGNVSLEDVGLLWFSGRTLAASELPESLLAAVRSGIELLGLAAEV